MDKATPSRQGPTIATIAAIAAIGTRQSQQHDSNDIDQPLVVLVTPTRHIALVVASSPTRPFVSHPLLSSPPPSSVSGGGTTTTSTMAPPSAFHHQYGDSQVPPQDMSSSSLSSDEWIRVQCERISLPSRLFSFYIANAQLAQRPPGAESSRCRRERRHVRKRSMDQSMHV